jgi:hypothetical protein
VSRVEVEWQSLGVEGKENWRLLAQPPGTSQFKQDTELSKPGAFR